MPTYDELLAGLRGADDAVDPPAAPAIPIVIVGAGQAGLAVAYYLQRFGLRPQVDFVLLDRAPMSGGAWQFRWSALRMGAAHRVNDLPGMDVLGVSFATANSELSAGTVVSDYYRRYEEYYGFQVRRPAQVHRVSNDGPDLLVEFVETIRITEESSNRRFFGARRPAVPSSREQRRPGAIRAQYLVNATGTWGAPFVPYYPGMHAFAGRHIHAADFREAEAFRGANVVVVGGGTTAVEFLLNLEPVANELTWVTRRPVNWVDRDEPDLEYASELVFMQEQAALAGEALPSVVRGTGVPRTDRVRAAIARGTLVERPMFHRIDRDRVVWLDGTERRADVLLWATGFRPDLRHLAPLGLREKAGGVTIGQGVSMHDSRIFLAGYGPQASTTGANRSGRMIARQLIALRPHSA